jgi:hypothetical protein
MVEFIDSDLIHLRFELDFAKRTHFNRNPTLFQTLLFSVRNPELRFFIKRKIQMNS